MNILFLSHYKWPHVGGVERHVQKVSGCLSKRGYKVRVITEKDLNYPRIRIIGLLCIWFKLFKLRKLIDNADIVHIHDVFIWYLPFILLYPRKKVFLTIHGLEWNNPYSWWSLFQKRIAIYLSNGSIGVGKFLEKYIGCKFDYIIYGGIEKHKKYKKTKGLVTYVGRLEPDTGLLEFLKTLKKTKNKLNVNFVGDGSLRVNCERFGKVYEFTDALPFYSKAETVVPSGYLTYLEAKSYGCKIKTFYGSKLKKEYWQEILNLKKFDTWEEVSAKYIQLWEK